MPVQMGDNIAKTRKVDFVGNEDITQGSFDNIDDLPQVLPVRSIKLAHFAHVSTPDNTRKAGIVGFVGSNHAHALVAPQHARPVVAAQWAVGQRSAGHG